MTVNRLTHPKPDVLSLDEVKDHCLPGGEYDDNLLGRLLKAARSQCERQTELAFATSTWSEAIDCFPAGDTPIELTMAPLQAVTLIRYVDSDGAEQTFEDFTVDTYATPGRIFPAASWPVAKQGRSILIEYTAGFTGGKTPEEAKQAVLLLMGHWYENREAVVTGTITAVLPKAVDMLLDSLRWRGR